MPNQRSARLARKARRLLQSETDREFDREVRRTIARRDDALRKLSTEFIDEIEKLKSELTKRRAEVWETYDSTRASLIRKHAE